MINKTSFWLNKRLGRWWLCIILFGASLVVFGWIVPNAVAVVTENRTLTPKILDEYYLTWTPADARSFYAALGAHGREALRAFYLYLDFWFPVLTLTLCYISLLSLAFRPDSRFAVLNLAPLIMYASDAAENLNHFSMAGSYPVLSPSSLAWGPVFTGLKWTLMTLLPLLAVAGFGERFARFARLQNKKAAR